MPPESVTSLPYREGLGLGGCLFASFSAPEKVRIPRRVKPCKKNEIISQSLPEAANEV
jgi:hypothetical protein